MRTTSGQLQEAATVRRAATALAARARVERKGDLSLNQVAVLGRVATHGLITPGEVAAQLRTMPQTLTRTFAVLEDLGYLRRTPDPSDGRQSLLDITAAGRAALRAEMRPRDRWLATAMQAALSPDERAALHAAADLMARLVNFGGDVAWVER